MRRSIAGVSGLAIALLCAGSVFAEDEAVREPAASEVVEAEADAPPAPETPPTRKRQGIEEIKVTARKREELLQRTPVAVTAFGERDLEAGSVSRVDELGKLVPNMKWDATNGGNKSSRIYIRGFGQDDFRSLVDPGVGLYVDGVYLPRVQGTLFDVYEMERIEVLRGPQGTLYGKNTIGGAVNFITKKPGPEFGATATLRGGDFDQIESRATLNVPVKVGPLEDRLFTRVSFASATDDGYVENFDGHRTGTDHMLATRFAARALPNDHVTFDLSYDFRRENEYMRIAECRVAEPFSVSRLVTDNWASTPGAALDAPRFPDACQTSQDVGPLDGFADPLAREDADTHFVTGIFEWDAARNLGWESAALDLKYTGAYRLYTSENERRDLDFTLYDFIGATPTDDEQELIHQEIQLSGQALENRLVGTLGFFWFEDFGQSTVGGDILRQLVGVAPGQFLAPDLVGPPIDFFVFDALSGPAGERISDGIALLNQRTNQRYDTISWAVYGEATYSFFDRLHLTAGLRFTRERKERGGSLTPQVYDTPVEPCLDLGKSFTNWSPAATVAYDVTEEVFGYFRYARGWKSGGFNDTCVTEEEFGNAGGLAGLEFDDEKVESFEVGVKTRWLDNRLTVNVTGFWNLYKDLQLTELGLNDQGIIQAFINNAADATTRGVEVEATWLADFDWLPGPGAGFLLQGSLGFIDAFYDEFDGTRFVPDLSGLPPGVECTSLAFEDCGGSGIVIGTILPQVLSPVPQPVDKSGLDFKNTPEWQYALAGTYFFDVRDWGALSLRMAWSWQDEVFYDVDNSATLRQRAYGLLDTRVAFETQRFLRGATLAFFIKNALDERFRDGGFSLGESIGADVIFLGRPRTFGGELTIRY